MIMAVRTYRILVAAYPVFAPAYLVEWQVRAASKDAACQLAFDLTDRNLSTYQFARRVGALRRVPAEGDGTREIKRRFIEPNEIYTDYI